MPWPQPVTALLDRISATPPIDVNTEEGRLNALSSALSRLSDELREQIQAATAAQVTPLISLLKADGPIEAEELELIRLWLVGDAEYYVKTENDLPAWVAELDRLLGVLRQLRSETATRPRWPVWKRRFGMPSEWPATSRSFRNRRSESAPFKEPPRSSIGRTSRLSLSYWHASWARKSPKVVG
jgi:hypothetical protein